MRQTRVFAPRGPSTVCSHLTVAPALSVPCRHSCRHVLAATDEKSGLKLRPRSADYLIVTSADDLEHHELQLNRFKRLIGELIRGETTRNTFEAWEIDLLLDFEACELPLRRLEILRQYQRAVERQLESGPGPPMKLSHFLILREQRRNALE